MRFQIASLIVVYLSSLTNFKSDAFTPSSFSLSTKNVNANANVNVNVNININAHSRMKTDLGMAMDGAMINRLDGIKRSYQALTERLADPDVIADSNLLMKVMSDRSKSEDVVNCFDEVSTVQYSTRTVQY
jgi:hypothetical protein